MSIKDEMNELSSPGIGVAVQLFQEKQQQHFDQWQANKPTVMVVGRSGAGKSTLINATFGEKVAQQGTGRPVTQSYTFYSSDNTLVDIYDTRGWEGGADDEKRFYEETKRLLAERETLPDAIWYVVEGPGARFTKYDQKIIHEIFKQIDVIVIITKSDITHEQQIHDLKNAIQGANLENVRDIIALAAEPNQGRSSRKSLRERVVNVFRNNSPIGLKELISTTTKLLPESRKRIFIAAQRADMEQKASQVRNRIILSTMKATSVSVVGTFVPVSYLNLSNLVEVQMDMLGEIANVYDIGIDLSHTIGAFVVERLATEVGKTTVVRVLNLIGGSSNVANATINGSVAASITMIIGFAFRSLYHAIIQYSWDGKLEEIDNAWVMDFLNTIANKISIDLKTKRFEEYDYNE